MSSADPDKPRPRFRIEFLPDLRRARSGDQQKGPYILVVEDEANIARLVQINLERHGYHVETASDGAEGLAKVRQRRPDLLVIDEEMPEMDGRELIAAIRRDPGLMDMPVILLAKRQYPVEGEGTTGYNCEDVYGQGIRLVKPFNPAEIITFAKRILSSNNSNDGSYGEQSDGSFLIIDFS